MASSLAAKYVVIGGGIAGVTCAEYLSRLDPDARVVLIAATDVIKTAVTSRKFTERLEERDVLVKSSDEIQALFPNVIVVIGFVVQVDADDHLVRTTSGITVNYFKLCVCTGAKPDLISTSNPHVIGIRDTDTVADLQKRLASASRVLVVGNGGIALELVFEITGCEVVWCIKHDHIGNTFLDQGAATFLLPALEKVPEADDAFARKLDQLVFRRKKYQVDRQHLAEDHTSGVRGTALGPDWSSQRSLAGAQLGAMERPVHIEYGCECTSVFTPFELWASGLVVSRTANEPCDKEWRVYARLSNGKVFGADVIVSATGALPFVPFHIRSTSFANLSEDGALIVDSNMRTSVPHIYAAGDCCKAGWERSDHWFQMQLWTQGWQTGAFAGKCMVAHSHGEELPLDFCFELFTHATTFFGYKVCLLGLFNGQGLGTDCEYIVRCTKGVEYIKIVLQNGRVQGALLIGETDMEETFENLIVNRMDVSRFGASLLDPDVDIDDYFD